MASPIARRPAGLLDLLLTQQQGKNPSELGDMLLPIIDLAPFYEQERFDADTLNAVVDAVGDGGTFTVPAGEAWKVIYMGVRGTFATAGQSMSVISQLQGLPGNTVCPIAVCHFASAVIGDKFGDGISESLYPDVIYPSGTSFRYDVSAVDLDGEANITATGTILYIRMET